MLAKHVLYQLSYTPKTNEGSSPLELPRSLKSFPYLPVGKYPDRSGACRRLSLRSEVLVYFRKRRGKKKADINRPVGPGRVELPTSTLSV